MPTVTPAFGRLFGTWTLVTCMLCVICSFNIHNAAIYGAEHLGRWRYNQLLNLQRTGGLFTLISPLGFLARQKYRIQPHAVPW